MQVRCQCGNELRMVAVRAKLYALLDKEWFLEESKEIQCPKCKSKLLPVELADVEADGSVLVRIVPERPIVGGRRRS